MNKQQISILERAFTAEIGGAIHKELGILQTRSKVAAKLAENGYLEEVEIRIGWTMPVVVKGYRLTHLGRLTYCATCEG